MEWPLGDLREVEAPGAVVCAGCQFEVAGVSAGARFCPRCGGELVRPVMVEVLVGADDASPLEPEYWSLRAELEANLAGATPPPVASSLVMLAYANAMLNLGWRYAHGRGLMRNEAEAGRCYAKAGRLSEAWGRK